MRPSLHKKALARFAIGVSAAAVIPMAVVAAAGFSSAPVALAAGCGAAILGFSALGGGGRRRVTSRARA